jgi:protein-S-isoprenylcysteine O-methyltransferase Ste14
MKKRILISQIAALAVIILSKPADWTLFAAGAGLMVLGQTIRFLASAAIVKSKTLTVSGPYAVIRNPLYLGTAVIMLGLLTALSNPQELLRTALAWLAAAASFTLIYRVQIKTEEEFLAAAYGAQFAAYKERVPAIFPRPSGLSGFFDRSAYSGDTFRKNKEWRGLLGMAAAAAIVGIRIEYGF